MLSITLLLFFSHLLPSVSQPFFLHCSISLYLSPPQPIPIPLSLIGSSILLSTSLHLSHSPDFSSQSLLHLILPLSALPISFHHPLAFLYLSSLLSIYISISLFLHLLSTSHNLSCPFQFAQLILSHSSSVCLSQFLSITRSHFAILHLFKNYKYSIPNFNMNIITLILCYFIYIAYLCIYNIFCIVYSLYEFVDEKVENKLKSNQNQIFPPYSLYTSPSLFFSIFFLHHTIFHALSFAQLILSRSSSVCLSNFFPSHVLILLLSIYPPYSLVSIYISIFYLHNTIFHAFRLLSLFFRTLPLFASLNFFPSHVLILLLSIFPPYSLYTSPSLFFSIFYLHHTIFHALSFGQLILSHSSSLCLSQFLTITALNLLFSIFPPYSLYTCTSPSLFFSIFFLHHTIFHALSNLLSLFFLTLPLFASPNFLPSLFSFCFPPSFLFFLHLNLLHSSCFALPHFISLSTTSSHSSSSSSSSLLCPSLSTLLLSPPLSLFPVTSSSVQCADPKNSNMAS